MQTQEEYLAELRIELERLEISQAKNPSKYKGERIQTLRNRLNIKAPASAVFTEPSGTDTVLEAIKKDRGGYDAPTPPQAWG